jgi:hypothetical protein
MAKAADRMQIDARSDLVVGVHERNEHPLPLGVLKQVLQVSEVRLAVRLELHPVHLGGTGIADGVGREFHRMVLNGTGDDVLDAQVAHGSVQYHVVRLGAAAGEDDLARSAMQEPGDGPS